MCVRKMCVIVCVCFYVSWCVIVCNLTNEILARKKRNQCDGSSVSVMSYRSSSYCRTSMMKMSSLQ